MTRAKITSDAEYLTAIQQRIRSVGLNAEMFARVREDVLSDPRFSASPDHVREEIVSALETRRLQIAKLASAI